MNETGITFEFEFMYQFPHSTPITERCKAGIYILHLSGPAHIASAAPSDRRQTLGACSCRHMYLFQHIHTFRTQCICFIHIPHFLTNGTGGSMRIQKRAYIFFCSHSHVFHFFTYSHTLSPLFDNILLYSPYPCKFILNFIDLFVFLLYYFNCIQIYFCHLEMRGNVL